MKIKEIMNDTSHLLGLIWEHSASWLRGTVASSLVGGYMVWQKKSYFSQTLYPVFYFQEDQHHQAWCPGGRIDQQLCGYQRGNDQDKATRLPQTPANADWAFNNNCQSIFTLQTKETLSGCSYLTKESGAAGRYEGQIGWINSWVLQRSDWSAIVRLPAREWPG